MALVKKVYGVRTPVSPRIFAVHGVFDYHPKNRKPVASQSEIGNLRRLQLKLQFVSDQGNKFGIGGLAFRIADRISKETLEGIQVTSVPGHFDGMTNGTLHTGRGRLECLGDLRVQYLGDGVNHIHVVDGNDDGFS